MIKILENLIIFILHIALLYWIIKVLHNAGSYSLLETMLHFSGLATYGALLIIGSAKIVKRRFLKETHALEK